LTSPAIGTATNPSNIYDSTWAQTIAGIEGGLEQLLGKEQLMALRETLNRIIAVEGAKPRPH
jgi:hypothetical protein